MDLPRLCATRINAYIRELEICTRFEDTVDSPFRSANGLFDLYDYDQLPLSDVDVDFTAEGCFLSRLGSPSSVTVSGQFVEFFKLCVNLRKLALNIECSLSNDAILIFETFQLRMLAISTLG